jgi:2-keto-4-pentenoate hydratase
MVSMNETETTGDLASVLVTARLRHAVLDTLPAELRPSGADEAYAVQHATLDRLKASIGGWKVGAKSPTGPIQGSPLPGNCVHGRAARLDRTAYAKPGLELEIAFTLGRRFEAMSTPHSDEEVLDAVESMRATIEVVASRFTNWPDVDKLWQLADLQNHGALVVGEAVPYDPRYPFVAPSLRFTLDGTSTFEGLPSNPAGDPRRLLGWLVNHAVSRGVTLEPGTVITTGSYTGIHFPTGPGVVVGEIDGLPPVELTLS